MLISIVHKLKVNVEVHVHVSNLQLSVTLYTSILKLVCACTYQIFQLLDSLAVLHVMENWLGANMGRC